MNWTGIKQLNANLTVDSSFTAARVTSPARCVTVLGDGNALVGGDFPRRLMKLSASGAVAAWNPQLDGAVHALAAQADGKVIVVGAFTAAGPLPRSRVARLTNQLTVEPAYNPDAGHTVYAVANTEDGETIVGGIFAEIGGEDRQGVARLLNDPADSTLTVSSASLITWQRAGSLPETQRVVWQVDTGSGYGALAGVTTRTAGGWQLVPTTALSGAGSVRALALPVDGHSSGVQAAVKSYNFAPEIVVEIGGVDTASGGTLNFGDVQASTTKELQFTIRNTGLAALTITDVVLGGTAAARYAMENPAGSVPALGSKVCLVRFSPTTLGAQPATLTLTNNDADEGTFVINLLGTATPGPGGQDTSWQPSVTGAVAAISLHPDRVLIGGAVTAVSAQARPRWAALSPVTAAVLPQSGAASDREVQMLLPLLDGRTLVIGRNVAGSRMWLVNAAGVTQTTPAYTITGGYIYAGCVQPDGGVVLVGDFGTFNGVARDGGVRLLPTTLTVDPNWNAPIGRQGFAVVADSRGRLWVRRNDNQSGLGLNLCRLLATGERDSSVTVAGTYQNSSPPYLPVAITANDGVLIQKEAITGTVNPIETLRLTSAGVLDATFAPTATISSRPYLQVDGKMIALVGVSGDGSKVRRLQPTGAVDASFISTAAPFVNGSALAVDAAGRVYTSMPVLQRLINSAGAQSLNVVSVTRVVWSRSGSLPEASWVRLDLSEDNGSTWRHLGLCTRMVGGWEMTGLSLPRNGRVRVQAWTGGGLVSTEQAYTNLPVPDLVIERDNVALASGAFVSFAGRIAGGSQSSDVTLTLRNVGLADLTNLVAAVSASDFRVVSQGLPGQADPSRLAPQQETQLVLRFTPTLTSARSGTLTITSNVPGSRGVVTLTLIGNGITNPAATTQAATLITQTAARLNAAFQANDDAATLSFEYRRSIDTAWTSVSLAGASGFTTVTRLYELGGLTAGAVYVFRGVATNSLSTRLGIERTFTTLP